MQHKTITASPSELQALSDMLNRTPTTPGEKVLIEILLTRWYNEISAQVDQPLKPAPQTP